MREVPHPAPVDPWLGDDAGEVLTSEPYAATDDLYGQGEGHFFGPTLESRIVFYPEHKTVEYEDANVYVVFKRPSRILMSDEAVFITTRTLDHWSHASVGRDGFFALMSQSTSPALEDERLGRGEVRVDRSDDDKPPSSEPVAGSSPGAAEYPIRQSDSSGDHFSDTSANSPQPANVQGVDKFGLQNSQPSVQVKEKPKPFPTVGTVHVAPRFRAADEHRHAYLWFVLDREDEEGNPQAQEVYSTKKHAERLNELALQVGERVTVHGLYHQTEQRDREGKPLLDETGRPLTKRTIYAFGASRLPDPA